MLGAKYVRVSPGDLITLPPLTGNARLATEAKGRLLPVHCNKHSRPFCSALPGSVLPPSQQFLKFPTIPLFFTTSAQRPRSTTHRPTVNCCPIHRPVINLPIQPPRISSRHTHDNANRTLTQQPRPQSKSPRLRLQGQLQGRFRQQALSQTATQAPAQVRLR